MLRRALMRRLFGCSHHTRMRLLTSPSSRPPHIITALDRGEDTPREAAYAMADVVARLGPSLDEGFVAWLKFTINEEQLRLQVMRDAGAFLTEEDEADETSWLSVLMVVRGGVYRELGKKYERYVTPISYILRLQTPKQRSTMIRLVMDDLTPGELPEFKGVVDRIVGCAAEEERLAENLEGVRQLGEVAERIFEAKREAGALLKGGGGEESKRLQGEP